jgi:hypothetical protein
MGRERVTVCHGHRDALTTLVFEVARRLSQALIEPNSPYSQTIEVVP